MEHFIAGTFGGISGVIISHPFDTLRVRYQTGTQIKGHLYKGILPPLISVGIEKAIVFGVYNNMYVKCKQLINNDYICTSASGFTAGFVSSLIITPFEYAKINMQHKNKINIKNMYKGWSATMPREAVGFSIYFTTFEFIKNKINRKMTNTETFMAGAFTGAFSWLFIYPFDMIKTNLQFEGNKHLYLNNNKHLYLHNNKHLYLQNIRKLYKGFPLALLRAVPLHGGAFLGYTFIINILNK